MKIKPAHTPTPWKSLGEIILDEKGVEIGLMNYMPNKNSHANATFIVRAVNAHEEMLKELKVLANELARTIGHSPRLTAIETLIAKAEGE